MKQIWLHSVSELVVGLDIQINFDLRTRSDSYFLPHGELKWRAMKKMAIRNTEFQREDAVQMAFAFWGLLLIIIILVINSFKNTFYIFLHFILYYLYLFYIYNISIYIYL